MAFELWLRQPKLYMDLALASGVRRFTWHVSMSLAERREVLGWMRNAAVGYGDISVMLVDDAGAAEYSIFDDYKKPRAVYPTWSVDQGVEALIELMDANVADDPDVTNAKVPTELRPVPGQKHRVVVYDIGADRQRNENALRLRDLQINRPHCELFISCHLEYNSLFGMGFKAGDAMPINLTRSSHTRKICLPSGKQLPDDYAFDKRYSDWFSLLGWSQADLIDNEDFTLYNIQSLMWAAKNWDLATPFVQRVVKSRGARTVFMPNEFMEVSDTDFVLPAGRRILMRNLGKGEELDKFTCDTCMLHNACTLARRGSVCGVKGSDGMELAKYFGTRNAQSIITGLDSLVKLQAERLEDAVAEEKTSGETNPDVTKQIKGLMDSGVKLAKLLDPTLAGGPKVQVNVGVGAGGAAQVAVAAADPKQMVASIMAELESKGIPREEITSDMIKAVLTGMANQGKQQAITGAAVAHQQKNGVIEGDVA